MNDLLRQSLELAFPGGGAAPAPRVAYWDATDSPIGTLYLATGEDGRVRRVTFRADEHRFVDTLLDRGWLPVRDRRRNDPLRRQLDEFFVGQRRGFDLAVDLSAVAPFTRAVLEACARVPYGRWDTYGGIAAAVGSPRAARAVGNALGDNPVPLVVPCHRVLAAGGRIGGYASGLPGGLDIKRHLLALEGVRVA